MPWHRCAACPRPQMPPRDRGPSRACAGEARVASILPAFTSSCWTWRCQVPYRTHRLSCHSSRPGRGVLGVPQPGLALCSQWWGQPTAITQSHVAGWVHPQVTAATTATSCFLGGDGSGPHSHADGTPGIKPSRNGEAQATGQGLWARSLPPASPRVGLVGYYFSQAS